MASGISSKEYSNILCDPCKFRETRTQAISVCQDCSMNSCESCKDKHRSYEETRDHSFNQLKNIETPWVNIFQDLVFCREHKPEILDYLCEDHKKVCCVGCIDTAHNECTIKPLENAAKEDKSMEEVIKFRTRIQMSISQFENLKKERENAKTVLQNSAIAVRNEVRKIKTDVLHYLEKFERKVEELLSDKQNQVLQTIQDHIKTIDKSVKDLTIMSESCKSLEAHDELPNYVFMMNNCDHLNHCEKIKEDLSMEIKPVSFHLRKSDEIKSLLNCLSELVKEVEEPSKASLNFLDLFTTTKFEHLPRISSIVTGCTYMPDGKLAMCLEFFCNDSVIKVLTKDLKFWDELRVESGIWDVATIAHNEIAVTGKRSKQIHFFDISTEIVHKRSLDVDLVCYGVDFQKGKLFVSFWEDSIREVRVLKLDGKVIHTITIDEGLPLYIAVNTKGDKIAISTDSASTVLITDTTGMVHFTYTDTQLTWPRGVLFDNEDNLIVCGFGSNNLQIVKRNGTKHITLLNYKDGMSQPCCLAFIPRENTLVVGQAGYTGLLAFKLG